MSTYIWEFWIIYVFDICKATIPLDLNVGDTIKIIEVSPDLTWCKAKIYTKAELKEKRHIYGLSTFGSNAVKLKTSAENDKRGKEILLEIVF
jgi:hypothetical protein